MKKTSIIVLLFCLFLSLAAVIKADTREAYLIVTNPGEDMSSEINISWHSDIEGTYVEYTVDGDSEFNNAKKIDGECQAVVFNDTSTDLPYNSYQCGVNIKDLDAGQKYIYRVGKTTFSETYRFETAGTQAFSFLHISDVHVYPKIASRLEKAVTALEMVETKTPKIKFILATGDMVAYGGARSCWEDLYSWAGIKNYMFTMAVGNHDYYTNAATINAKNIYYNYFFNNPDNGAENVGNSTYFFKYNNTLFVSLDTYHWYNDSSLVELQKVWLDKVLSENPAQFVVVYTHMPFYYGSGSNSNQTTMQKHFQAILDKYSVDLVLSGHDHVYIRTSKIFNGAVSDNSKIGTVYMNGSQLGDRASTSSSSMNYMEYKTDGEVVTHITVSSDIMTIKTYDLNGNAVDTYSMQAKAKNFDSKKYLKNVTLTTSENDFSDVTLTYPNDAYGKAYLVEVQDENGNVLASAFPSYDVTTLKVSGISKSDTERKLKVVFYLRDGSTFDKTYTLKNNTVPLDPGTINNLIVDGNKLVWNNELTNDVVKTIKIKANGTEIGSVASNVTEFDLSSLNSEMVNEIVVEAIDGEGNVIVSLNTTYGTLKEKAEISLKSQNVTLTVGESFTNEITVVSGNDLEYSFESSDESVATVDENGKVTALKEGETTITVKVVGEDMEKTYVIKVEKAEETPAPAPTPEPAGGCNSGSIQNVFYIISTLGLAFVLKKKKY